MEKKQIQRLSVLNRDKRMVGILSVGHLALHASHELTGISNRGRVATHGLTLKFIQVPRLRADGRAMRGRSHRGSSPPCHRFIEPGRCK